MSSTTSNFRILSDEERAELLAPYYDHGHCWGDIAIRILRDATEKKGVEVDIDEQFYAEWGGS